MFDTHSFRAAAAHIAPVYLDPVASAEKAVSAIAEAARNGASIVVFAEAFLPGFPVWAAIHAPIRSHDLFAQYAAASVFADGPEIEMIRQAAARHDIMVSIGLSERNPASVGSLWNSNLLIDETGRVVNHHRKLVPTFYEKLVWDPGDGAGLNVSASRCGRVGALICGENTNPLSRYSLIAQGEQVHISTYPPIWPTRPPEDSGNYDNRAANHIRAAGHCFEAKCFGIVVASPFDKTATEVVAGKDPALIPLLDECSRAPSFFVDPTGQLIGESTVDEGIIYADIDLARCLEPKRFHDLAAGYNRFDIFDLAVTRKRGVPIRFTDQPQPPKPQPPEPQPPESQQAGPQQAAPSGDSDTDAAPPTAG
ncbi:carbon-nitrogen hydrolase family protein [Phaeobacter sp. J2-8]|uniref:carbon-nitrogen hydrolase family protein n=1 Tax=Phaeobacter sp. J2-8 TaxID=2931394 RepID=UPI001FD02C8F|nr:carbon-nitrogen hydrolase family protein [Phaeobacter sp. J2-8]MCJ7874015.1 carbon-nitrogen hydrolase family protein [Phaeobacter sp. J2-8]